MPESSRLADLKAALSALHTPIAPGTYQALSVRYGYSVPYILNVMSRLRAKGAAHGRQRIPWTAAQLDQLHTEWRIRPLPTVARRLHRTEMACIRQLIDQGWIDEP